MNETVTPDTLTADAGQGEPLRVQLDIFDGPLDLLLSLIKEQQLDIATVPLAAVAEQYLTYVRMMEALDVEVAAEYLVIAATLVFLKSKALLPPIPQEFLDESEETPEQVEERLRRRLIAYSQYRELGQQLKARQDEASGYYFRESGDPTSELIQKYRVDPEKLKRAFLAMLQAARPEKREIVRERMSLIATMDFVARAVKERGEVMFSTLCHEMGMTREAIIVVFLAVLELIRRDRVSFDQPDHDQDIRIFREPKPETQG